MGFINIGIFAHIDAGKTTLTEQILYQCGKIYNPGSIEEGTTESDSLLVEIERGISVLSSILQFSCNSCSSGLEIHLIDTPGHLDFRSQVISIMNAIDIAVVLVDAIRGIESQTQLIYDELSKVKIPKIFFINKLDRGKDYLIDCLVSLEELLGYLPHQLFHEDSFHSIWNYPNEFTEKEHLRLFEWNEDYSEKFLQSPDKLYELSQLGLVHGIWEQKIIPVLGGSAKFGDGVENLIQLLSLLEKSKIFHAYFKEIKNINNFYPIKRILHPELGRLTISRACRELEISKNYIYNNHYYSFQNFYRLYGYEVESVSKIREGELFASSEANSISWEHPQLEQNFSIRIEPEQPSDFPDLIEVLRDLVWEDPSYRLEYDEEVGSWFVFGNGELHLEVLLSRLQEKFKKNYYVGNISVARYELLKKMEKKLVLEHSAFDTKLSSGRLAVVLRDTANFSKQLAFGVSLSEKLQNAIYTGFQEALSRGNYHLEVLGVELLIQGYEPPSQDHSALLSLMKVAVVGGIRNAIQGLTDIIGPVTYIEVELLDEDIGNVLSLLQKRGAKVLNVHKRQNNWSAIHAKAATENILGISGAIRNMTRGTSISYLRNAFSFQDYVVLEPKGPLGTESRKVGEGT